jgi:PIN domain nuclease of toxin-antitoxin system
MKYLLDAMVWVWTLDSIERLNRDCRNILENGQQEIYLSAATAWEISVKMRLNKLQFPAPAAQSIPRLITQQGLRPLPITHAHAAKTYALPLQHPDPFDRLLIAQAMVEKMWILTADRHFEKYAVDVVWCGG